MSSITKMEDRIKKLRVPSDPAIVAQTGFFLAVRQVRRSNPWTNILIVSIMTLTFLNLVVVSGILVGLIEGAVEGIKSHYLGDIFISNLENKTYTEQSQNIISAARNLPGVKFVTARYIESGTIEANYKNKLRQTDMDDSVGASIAGIDPRNEEAVTQLSSLVIKGEFIEENDFDKVVVGAMLLSQYLDFDSPNFPVLDNVGIGSKIRVTIAGNTREVIVKGITKSKVDEIDRRVFFPEKQFRALIGRNDFNADEIVLRLERGVDPLAIKRTLINFGFGNYARVQTQEDAEPKFIKDMKKTFAILGNVISSIGLAVAAITIFIVIFINAITRRKFIGILKGIGIDGRAIEFSYILQSLFYAILGSLAGCVIVFLALKPYFDAFPINFPFSDGILVVSIEGVLWRIAVLIIATVMAGYIPARLVVRQNTLDAILGR